jgi:hypothetical protein
VRTPHEAFLVLFVLLRARARVQFANLGNKKPAIFAILSASRDRKRWRESEVDRTIDMYKFLVVFLVDRGVQERDWNGSWVLQGKDRPKRP